MLTAGDFPRLDAKVARRVISVALSIAPALDSLEGEAKARAVAIIEGGADELPTSGSRRVRSRSRNGTSVSFDGAAGVFTPEERAALRALCGLTASPGAPVGSFPPSTITRSIWPVEPTR